MKILISGATGYIGRNLIFKTWNVENFEICALVRNKSKAKKIFRDLENLNFIDSSISGYQKQIKNFNPDIMIHLAAYSTSNNDYQSMKKLVNSNLVFGTEILDALKDTNLKLFINTGTFAEYYHNDGRLDSAYLYAATKTAYRSLLKYYKKIINFKLINVIPYSVYGEDDTRKKVIHYIIDSLDSDQCIDMTLGEQILDFIYIQDVVDFYISIIKKYLEIDFCKNNILDLHLGTGKGISIKNLANKIETISNKKTNINWGARKYRENDIMHSVAPISKNIECLDWKANYSLQEGLKNMIK